MDTNHVIVCRFVAKNTHDIPRKVLRLWFNILSINTSRTWILLIPLENSGTENLDAPRAECKVSSQGKKKIQFVALKLNPIAFQICATPIQLYCLLLMKQPAHYLPISISLFSLDSNRQQ